MMDRDKQGEQGKLREQGELFIPQNKVGRLLHPELQLKEFSLISPALEAKEIFPAIQTVIPPEARARALEKSNSWEKRKRKLPASKRGLLSNCHEHMVN